MIKTRLRTILLTVVIALGIAIFAVINTASAQEGPPTLQQAVENVTPYCEGEPNPSEWYYCMFVMLTQAAYNAEDTADDIREFAMGCGCGMAQQMLQLADQWDAHADDLWDEAFIYLGNS